MIFVNIESISPPLSLYPAAQRVTFLYYIGRFNFSNQHYHRAALCLQEAYLQTPPQLVSHRSNILTYLIPANLLLGRFPSDILTSRPEAQSLKPIFLPLCMAIRSGNFMQFQSHLAAHESWLLGKGLLLPLSNRLRPLLWRSLTRKTFILTYVPPTDASSRKAATLELSSPYCRNLRSTSPRRLAALQPTPTRSPITGQSRLHESPQKYPIFP